ncbi:MAG TPA: HEAT repeat domain-containing protein [Longimicrobium sp.]|nr:HEAT repeat domain-containing protein [Longimicrobium sp.]
MPPDDPLALLESPATRCEGARLLAARGDRGALLPLVRAYLRAGEGGGACLLEAIRDLGPAEGARELFGGGAEARAAAVRLLELFPDDAVLDVLERALSDPDAAVRAGALRALPLQWRTGAWQALLTRLLSSADAEVRAAAAALLAEQGSGGG